MALDPHVRFDPSINAWTYVSTPDEMRAQGYQFVPARVETKRARFGQDDYETRRVTVPAHWIDPSQKYRPGPSGQDSDKDRQYSPWDNTRNPADPQYFESNAVVDPAKRVSNNFQDLQKYGIWENIGDPNSPLYERYHQAGVQPTPQQMADTILRSGSLGLRSTDAEWQSALNGMQLSPDIVNGIRGTLTATKQDLESGPDFLDKAFPVLVGGALALMTGGAGAAPWLAGAAGGAGGAAAAGGDSSDILKGAVLGGVAPAVSGAVGGGVLGGAAGGATTAALTGGNVATGALMGAAAPAIKSGLGQSSALDTTASAGGISDAVGGAAASGGEDLGGGMWDWLDNIDFTTDPSIGDLGGNIDPSTGFPVDDPFSGLTPADLGQDASFTTNPSIADLGGDISSLTGLPGSPSLLDYIKQYGGQAIDVLKRLASGGGGAGGAGGTSIPGPFGNSLLNTAFDSTPFLLALAEANRQSGDLNGIINQINGDSYRKSVLDPYDLETGYGRSALQSDLGQRGVAGSSFGYQALNNYDYMRNLGRSDMASKANLASAGLQGQLINQRNTNRNLLLGAGLNASAKLFSPQQDPFNLRGLLGG